MNDNKKAILDISQRVDAVYGLVDRIFKSGFSTEFDCDVIENLINLDM